MKVLHDNAIKCAFALFAAAGLTACSSSDDVADDTPVNPSYDGNSVKTQFAINVPAVGQSTRMTGENTQQSGTNFLGMENIKIIPLTTTKAEDATTFPSSVIPLANINTSDYTQDTKEHKIYSDVSIPVGTQGFLFYGVSPMSTGNEAEKGYLNGFDNIESCTKTSEVEFSLQSIATSNFVTTQNALAQYLTTLIVPNWKDITEAENATMYEAYKNFTTASSGSPRAGSGPAILKMVQDLVTVVAPLKDNTTTIVAASKTVGEVATSIINAVKATYFDIDASNKVTWKSGTEKAIKEFPTEYDLPEGAAILTCDGSVFTYVNDPSFGTSLVVSNLTYPAAIAYRANSAIRTSTSDVKANDWPSTANNWENSSNWNSTTWPSANTSVTATTRAIAMKNNANYGVAQLVTSVKCNNSVLKDNSSEPISVMVGSGFPITGVLVGGQPGKIDWQYLPKSGETNKMTIWDSQMASGTMRAINGTYSEPNYTLVLDNYESTAKPVNIAVELENTSGTDFRGQDGVVYAGQKFYLVAQLDPSTADDLNWSNVTDDLNFPQKNQKRVFVQDFKTVARLNIKSLKYAYVTIPDLRSIDLQLGISVDLTWQNGLTFDVPIE